MSLVCPNLMSNPTLSIIRPLRRAYFGVAKAQGNGQLPLTVSCKVVDFDTEPDVAVTVTV
jgi:hypothetical protein